MKPEMTFENPMDMFEYYFGYHEKACGEIIVASMNLFTALKAHELMAPMELVKITDALLDAWKTNLGELCDKIKENKGVMAIGKQKEWIVKYDY